MKKHCVRILSAFFALAALAITAKGQEVDQLVVNIPFKFVIAGKTLPAGTYSVNRVSNQDERELVISSFENHAGVLVFSREVEQTHAGRSGVSFTQVGGQLLLNKIETAQHVFTFPVSRPTVRETTTLGK
jgi:hypothetical protein